MRQGSKVGRIKHLTGIAITLLCLFVFFQKINVSEIKNATVNFQWKYMGLGLLSLTVGYVLRVLRWRVMLGAAGAKVSAVECAPPFFAAIALNNLLPLRLGDVIRAFIFPKAMKIRTVTATSSLLVERLIDLMTLLLCLAFCLPLVQIFVMPAELKFTVMLLTVIGTLVMIFGFVYGKKLGEFLIKFVKLRSGGSSPVLLRVCEVCGNLLIEVGMMCGPRVLVTVLTLSLLVWCGEAGLFYFVLVGSGMEATISIALLIMSIATLSTLVPSSPGYVGAFHLAVFSAASLIGSSSAQAGSYAVIVHLALWIPTTLVGALAIFVNPALFRAAKYKTIEQ